MMLKVCCPTTYSNARLQTAQNDTRKRFALIMEDIFEMLKLTTPCYDIWQSN